jgi:hypothetical protein
LAGGLSARCEEMKHKLRRWALVVLVFLISLGYVGVRDFAHHQKSRRYQCYGTSSELLTNIKQLPMLGPFGKEGSDKDWSAYVAIARRMRTTGPGIITSALRDLTNPSGSSQDFEDIIKPMLLLRVCFECPPVGAPSSIRGGWFSYSAATAGRALPFDVNWPVANRLGRFRLLDSIDGFHSSHAYDAEAEFEWMLNNCTWRGL